MKKNSYFIDNRAEWKMRKIILENDMSDRQIDDLRAFASQNRGAAKTPKNRSFYSLLHSLRYIFG